MPPSEAAVDPAGAAIHAVETLASAMPSSAIPRAISGERILVFCAVRTALVCVVGAESDILSLIQTLVISNGEKKTL